MCDTFAFDKQCDDSVHASILISLSSLPSSSYKAPSNMPSFASLKLKQRPNYAFLGLDETLPVIIVTILNPNQEI